MNRLKIDIARIEAYRKKKGYTQEKISEKLGISRGSYAMKVKRGRFHAEELYALANILGAKIDDFFRPAV